MIRKAVLSILAACLAAAALAQQQVLTLEKIYDPRTKENFGGIPQRNFVWIDDTSFLWPRTDAAGHVVDYLLVDVKSGAQKRVIDPTKLKVQRTPETSEDAEAARQPRRPLELNEKRDTALFHIGGDLYTYGIRDGVMTQLTSTAAREDEGTFSPDGKTVAFLRDFDIHLIDLGTRQERRLTTGGSRELLNGRLDWVYQEEIYGRGKFRAYWWSPDSKKIAYLQFDEKDVPEFTIPDHLPYRQKLDVTHYPKAGDPNPRVKLLVADLELGRSHAADLQKYAGTEILISDVNWAPDSGEVIYQVQDREQTWLDLDFADAATGSARTLFRETTPAWVDNHGSPEWLDDGTFLWFSERSGYKHLYRYRRNGALVRQITSGPWEVRTLHGVDEKNRWIYFSGTERSPIGSDVYRVRLDGSDLIRLSSAEGTHAASFSPGFVHFLDTWSDVQTPPQVHLHRADGSRVRSIDANPVTLMKTYFFSTPEFLQVPTAGGFLMEAVMIKPPDFDPSRKYPVYQHTYGGPHAQQVRNAWSDLNTFHQLLARNGIIVWVCDNQTASGKGASSTWPMYKRAGETELRDIEDGLAWLKRQPYIDGSRIMMGGWSYGGYMVAYALTHSSSFVAGISGAPVTDWRDYDTIYTERFMLMPQHNEEGYRRSSPRFAAADLHGKLLLLHGTTDDNVHLQNTIQFAYELQKAAKPFELMIYPRSRHAISDPAQVLHLRRTMLDFILRNLRPRDEKSEIEN